MAEFFARRLLHNYHVNNDVGEDPTLNPKNIVFKIDTITRNSNYINIRVTNNLVNPNTEMFIDWGDGTREDFQFSSTAQDKVFTKTYIPGEFKLIIGTKNEECLENIFITGDNGLYLAPIYEVSSWGELELGSLAINGYIKTYKPFNKGALSSRCDSAPRVFNSHSIDVPEKLFEHYPNITDFSGLFENCYNLAKVPFDILRYANGPVTTDRMFYGAYGPHSLSELTKNINYASAQGMFENCLGLYYTDYAFENCEIYGSMERLFSGSTVCECAYTFMNTRFYSNCNLDYAFSNCNDLYNITELFSSASFNDTISLTGIFMNSFAYQNTPAIDYDMFAFCNGKYNITSLREAFKGLPNVHSAVYEYWNDYDLSNVDKMECFRDSTALGNYYDIPDEWK